MGLFDKAKEAHKQKQEEKARLAAAEEARKQKILKGELVPISAKTPLQPNETAYLELTARRMASVNSTVQETVGKTKKKHVLRRAVVGTVLLGPVGTIAGAATAGSKQTATTTERTITSVDVIDSGELLLTNYRVIFTGNNGITSIPYKDITGSIIDSNGHFEVKYPGMASGEYFEVFGENAKDADLYYKGIRQHLIAQPSKPITPKTLPAQRSVADELTKLVKLKQDGVITQAEFEKQKADLLA